RPREQNCDACDAFSPPRDAPRDASRDPRSASLHGACAPRATLGLVILPINPVVVAVGPLAVRWFGLLALLGLGVAVWLSLRDLERARLSRRVALDALAWAVPIGLLAGRLVHVLGWWDYYLLHAAELWRLDVAGLSLWGGLLGGMAIAAARLGRDQLRRRRICDVVAPHAAVGMARGHLGRLRAGHGQCLP